MLRKILKQNKTKQSCNCKERPPPMKYMTEHERQMFTQASSRLKKVSVFNNYNTFLIFKHN